MLSERSQTEGHLLHGPTYMESSRKGKAIKTEDVGEGQRGRRSNDKCIKEPHWVMRMLKKRFSGDCTTWQMDFKKC